MKTTFPIIGMHCASCAKLIEKNLKGSEHSLAEAILSKAQGQKLADVTQFKAIPGLGISGVIAGKLYFFG